jgi:hypothetical protein
MDGKDLNAIFNGFQPMKRPWECGRTMVGPKTIKLTSGNTVGRADQ